MASSSTLRTSLIAKASLVGSSELWSAPSRAQIDVVCDSTEIEQDFHAFGWRSS
jgi:hypothetical protein